MSDDEMKRRKEEIGRIKGDEALLRRAYVDAGGRERDLNHNQCLNCGDATAFSMYLSKPPNEFWRFKCQKCGVGGTIIDLVMLSQKCGSDAAIDQVISKYGSGVGGAPAPRKEKKPLKSHPGPDDAIDAALWVLQQREPAAVFVKKWVYQRANCEPFGQVARFDIPKVDPETGEKYVSKEFRPVVFCGTGWKVTKDNSKGEKWPMYKVHLILKELKCHGTEETQKAQN